MSAHRCLLSIACKRNSLILHTLSQLIEDHTVKYGGPPKLLGPKDDSQDSNQRSSVAGIEREPATGEAGSGNLMAGALHSTPAHKAALLLTSVDLRCHEFKAKVCD